MADEKPAAADETVKKDAETEKPAPKPEVPPVETHHELALGNKMLRYSVRAGMMPIKNVDSGETEANIFFTAYTLDEQPAASRPLTFVFNGGPGSASVWLHLGALGPYRVKMQDEGWMPAPPYRLVPNEHTWLDLTDLVFIDPVGTGYSRAVKAEDNKKYWNLQADFESVGEFIRLYLTRYERWSSPLLLAGESYGTTRAAGLAAHLFDKGIALNGLALISTVLNFQTIIFERGNDLPYALFLPTYTATAWYHHKLNDELQNRPLREVLVEVEAWAENVYTMALAKGDRLTAEGRTALVEKLAQYTGLKPEYVEQSKLRINPARFFKEILRDENRTVGRLDSRFKGRDALAIGDFPEFDPSMTAITPPYTAMINDYVRGQLGYETDLPYETLSYKANGDWEWDRGKFPDTSEPLRSAFARNPFMHAFLAMGLYDLATPHFATLYTLDHMDFDPEMRDHLHFADYEAGHMLYLDVVQLAKLKADIVAFMRQALP
ncbi:MAG: peptidase S10 [Anaerolineae bacterium]|nr:peptidase S10 [Anaerolineae bacterium]